MSKPVDVSGAKFLSISGVILLELMVSISLALLFSGAIYQIYLSANSVYMLQNNINELQYKITRVSGLLHAEIHRFRHVVAGRNDAFTLSDGRHISCIYINKTRRQNARGKFVMALYSQGEIHHAKELEQDIISMKLLYAILKNKTYIFLLAEEIHEWEKVVGVSVNLEFEIGGIKKSWKTYLCIGCV